MRSRSTAVLGVVLMAATALSPVAAHAAASSTLYVNSNNSACDDSGPGSADVPFCQIQTAFDVVEPGDVVNVASGVYAPATLSRTGTADAPIVVVGPTRFGNIEATAPTMLTLAEVSNVEIEHMSLWNKTGDGVLVNGGSNILLTHDMIMSGNGDSESDAVHVTGGATAVQVQDGVFDGSVVIDDGSTGTVLSTGYFNNVRGIPITVNGASNTAVTSNTVMNCGPGIDVGSSSGTRIENNIVSVQIAPDCPPDAQQSVGIAVDTDSTASTTADYNDVWAGPTGTPYLWGTAPFTTAASFYAVTGQGLHDDNSENGPFVHEHSPAIDSADSAAIGEQATDIYGEPRVADPLVAHTGAGPYNDYDRGAFEFEDPYDPLPSNTVKLVPTEAPTGVGITVTANLADTWGDTFSSYQFEGFDGNDHSVTVTSTSPSATMTFDTPGTYSISVDAQATGSQVWASLGWSATKLDVVTPQPFTVKPVLDTLGIRTIQVSAGGTDDWNPTGFTFDLGDGKPSIHVQPGALPFEYTYDHVGTYTITETMTDSGGNTASGSIKYTTSGSDYHPYGPTRLLDTRTGIGAARAKVAVGQAIALKIGGNGSIPVGVTAVALNLTVTDAVGDGSISVEPDGTAVKTSNLDYLAGQTRTNFVIVPVAEDGKIDLHDFGTAHGRVDLIGDVSGYFTATQGSGYTPLTRKRVLDTRVGLGAARAKVGPNRGLSVGIVGADSIPAGATAVAVHVTVVDTTGNGWIAAEPDGAGTPSTSILNYLKDQTLSNTIVVPVARDGKIELYNGGGTSVDLVADVSGYFSATSVQAYVPVTPYRAWNTRSQGSILRAHQASAYLLVTHASQQIPYGATLVTNFTVSGEDANGYITAYPEHTARPGVSDVNFLSGQTVAGLSVLSATGGREGVAVYDGSSGRAQLIADVFGYFSS